MSYLFGPASVGMMIVSAVYDARLTGRKIWWFPQIGEVSGFLYGFIINVAVYLLCLAGILWVGFSIFAGN